MDRMKLGPASLLSAPVLRADWLDIDKFRVNS